MNKEIRLNLSAFFGAEGNAALTLAASAAGYIGAADNSFSRPSAAPQ